MYHVDDRTLLRVTRDVKRQIINRDLLWRGSINQDDDIKDQEFQKRMLLAFLKEEEAGRLLEIPSEDEETETESEEEPELQEKEEEEEKKLKHRLFKYGRYEEEDPKILKAKVKGVNFPITRMPGGRKQIEFDEEFSGETVIRIAEEFLSKPISREFFEENQHSLDIDEDKIQWGITTHGDCMGEQKDIDSMFIDRNGILVLTVIS